MTLPTGTVTFLFTDIEGWTELVREHGDRAGELVKEYEPLLQSAFTEGGGHVVDVAGDTFVVAFTRAADALSAAADAQRRLAGHTWPDAAEIRIRMGVHTGEATLAGGRYFGLAVNRAAWICGAASGGQVLLSQTTADLAEGDMAEGLSLRDLGERSLQGFDRPVRLFQLLAQGIESDFPPPGPRRALPAGTVTFVFSDIEGSTRLTRALGDDWGRALGDYRRALRETFAAAGGSEVDSQGDGHFFVFGRARDAVAAAAQAQRSFAERRWPAEAVVRVRMGLHTGEPGLGEEGYVGLDVVRAARICAAGHGGQVLLSATTHSLVADDEIEGVGVLDLGEHRLKDLPRPERVYQLVIAGLQTRFEPLRAGEQGSEPPLPAVARERDLAAHVEETVRELRTSIEQSVADSLKQSLGKPDVPSRRRPRVGGLLVALATAILVLAVLVYVLVR